MIVLDSQTFTMPFSLALVRRLCHRNFGIGADGICLGPINGYEPFEMRFYNPDGSESEKSGNGLRIFARYLKDAGLVNRDAFKIMINEEVIDVKILNPSGSKIATGMGVVSFNSHDVHLAGEPREVIGEPINVGAEKIVVTAVSVGNPHCIIFSEDLSNIHHFGPLLETTPQFINRTNVQTLKVIDEHNIEIAIWERGAGYTLASGSSATATAAAAIRHGFCQSPVMVQMEGGAVKVDINEAWRASLTGSVASVFTGQISKELIYDLST